MRKMLWLVATLGSLSTAAAAVSPSQVVRATAEVTVVEVPVNVTGRDGKPVYGLSREDFTLEDDGVPQAIDSVDVVDLKRKSVDSELPSALPTAGRRHFLLLFDMSFASAYEIARSRDAAINFLQNAVAPEDYVAVATASIEPLIVTMPATSESVIHVPQP